MKLPARMLDLSSPLDNETVFDPPFMRPKIEYRTNAENAPMLLDNFPGLRREDLPDGKAGRSKLCNSPPTTGRIWMRRSITSRSPSTESG
jgi:hypothetical protein